MGKEFLIKAGETKQVLNLFSSSVPGQIRFRAETVDGSEPRGKVTARVQKWFSWSDRESDLAPTNILDKAFSESNYKVMVTPETDTKIIFETRHFRAEIFFVILAAIMILGLISGLTAFFFTDPATPSR